MRKILIFGIAFMVIIFLVWKNDNFQEWYQKKYYPNKYWSQKVEEHKTAIKTYRSILIDLEIEGRKLLKTAKYDIYQDINSAKQLNIPMNEAKERAIRKIQEKAKNLKKEALMWKDFLNEEQKSLKKAKAQLAKYQ